ncbi:universal stress protein [Yinghuangia aomiensis]
MIAQRPVPGRRGARRRTGGRRHGRGGRRRLLRVEEALAYVLSTWHRGVTPTCWRCGRARMTAGAAAAAIAADMMEEARGDDGTAACRMDREVPRRGRPSGGRLSGTRCRCSPDESEGAVALVVGTRGLGGFRGMLLGSVSAGLVHHARCPLVTVPQRDDL